jgi:hypothetical protein
MGLLGCFLCWHWWRGSLDLRGVGNTKQLLQPSRNLGTFFIGLLGRATTALSYRCKQFS